MCVNHCSTKFDKLIFYVFKFQIFAKFFFLILSETIQKALRTLMILEIDWRFVHFFRTVFLSPMMVLLLFNLILYHFTKKKKKNIQKIIIKNSSSMTRLYFYTWIEREK